MTAQHAPSAEDLAAVRDQLRAEIREARETLKDLRLEIREARTLVPLLTDELFNAEVKKHVDALGRATEKAMDQATDKVFASFDRLHDTLTGQDRQARRAGKTNLPDLIARAVDTTDAAAPDRGEPGPEPGWGTLGEPFLEAPHA